MQNKDILNQYKKNAINTASQGELIVMLYEGALAAISSAEKNMHYSSFDLVNEEIKKAVNIIDELRASLNKKDGGDIADKLESIYIYLSEQLIKGNMNKDSAPLKEVRNLLSDLLSAWREIIKGNTGAKNGPSDSKNSGLSSGFSISG